ncbi:glucan biosynthesis protein [Roseomonas sp. HJA6]|uniref:Glucan biosynthesis protein n=1 Tax=Roseomonas alba TaxID=2846776 RepID=A0ABS7A6T1_9PROT|nr:glucan biosynthesis protein [Neoroseomonas alba]MBW6397472.1 glucan biosynthesis protein [Neoroseomonas alba]
MRLRRRHLALLAGAAAAVPARAAAPQPGPPQPGPGATAFEGGTVAAIARDRAGKPPRNLRATLPRMLDQMDYDAWRGIRFRPDQALWRDTGLGFQVQPHHLGFLFKDRVDLFEVTEGRAIPLRYDPAQFTFDGPAPPADMGDIGFAGFRITHPLNRPDHFDEICAFLGASYFRALGRGHVYGISARGLAIRTASPQGEEFPSFTAFWIEKPAAGARSITVHALLESQSLTGAYRFVIAPGAGTVMEVEAELFPRTDVAGIGIAPGTSMFLFGPGYRGGISDFRPAVHDSDGLLMRNGRDEQIWRALCNPKRLQVSGFQDTAPRGFGLMQRARAFADYQDLEAHYQRRPGLWVEPMDEWGAGEVQLVEIPTPSEIHDNIVAAWVPKDGLKAGESRRIRYRLHWVSEAPQPGDLLRFAATRSGAGGKEGTVRFVLDTTPVQGRVDALPPADVTASAGTVSNIVVQSNPETGGLRLSFELEPAGSRPCELRAVLGAATAPVSESWTFRWTG